MHLLRSILRQLQVGSRGSDVSSLQSFLASNPAVYPQGLVTGYFGPLTMAAVVRFQNYFGIPAVGRVGPITLAKINSLISSGVGLSGIGGVVVVPGADITAPTITGVSVSPASISATVNWSTDEQSRGAVFYSLSPIQFQEITANGAIPLISGTPIASSVSFMTSQSVMIPNLTPNTTYYYSVFVIDASGNVSVTLNNSFHTNF